MANVKLSVGLYKLKWFMNLSFQELFFEYIEDRYKSVFPQQDSVSAEDIVDVVHRLMKTSLFI